MFRFYFEHTLYTNNNLLNDSHGLHEEIGVGVLGDAGEETVGEGEAAAGDFGFEPVVAHFAGEGVRQASERKVVGGNNAGDGESNELADQSERAFLLVDRIRTAQDFVENHKHPFACFRPFYHLLQARQLGKEIGGTVAQRVGRAQTGVESCGREGHFRSKNWCADERQQVVDGYGAQIGALSGHVGSRDDKERPF